MLPFLILTLGSISSGAYAGPLKAARATKSLGQFYAYGSNISGIPLFYADGKAYVGFSHPPGADVYTNVTLSQTTNNSLSATPTNETVNGNWTTPRLYIDTTEGSFTAAGFTSSTTSNSSITTTGFSMFGSMLVWTDGDVTLQSKWYAQPIDTGMWALKWNVDNVQTSDAVVVVLKNRAPSA